MDDEQKNILKDEELYGGFEPGSSEDETFHLESQAQYPGDLPYEFLDEASEIPDDKTEPEPIAEEVSEPEQLNQEVSEQQQVTEEITEPVSKTVGLDEFEVPSGTSVWDMFDENSSDELTQSKSAEEEKVEPEEATFSLEKDIDTLEISEPVEIDDDLKKLLQNELKSREEKLSSKLTDILPPVTVISSDTAFQPVEELLDTEEIELTGFDAEHPSTAGLKSFEQAEEPIAHKSVVEKKINEEIDEKSEESILEEVPIEEKTASKKPILLWKVIGASAAIIVFLASAILIGYLLFYKNQNIFNETKKQQKVDTLIVKKEPQNTPVAATIKDSTSKAAAEPKKIVIATKAEPKVKVKEMKPKILLEKPKLASANKSILKQEVKKTIAIKPSKPVLAHKVEKPAVKQTPTPIPKPLVTNNKKSQKPSQSVGEIYAIEVYSTPSKEDADDWVKRLRNKNLTDIRIKPQKIRDATWYKVRFGNFKTKEQAKDAARKYGFAQSWIDRIQ